MHRELRRALLSGELPLTRRLTEEQLAERFATSRTPVREALRRLEAEGHVVREGGELRPTLPRSSTMRELYELRIALEELVVRRAAQRAAGADGAGLEALHEEWAQLEVAWPRLAERFELPEFVRADEGFHEQLASLAGNATVARHLRDVNERIRLLRIHDFTTSDRIEATIAEHRAIAAAVVAGEVERAVALMRAHVEASAVVVEQRVAALLARIVDGDGIPARAAGITSTSRLQINHDPTGAPR